MGTTFAMTGLPKAPIIEAVFELRWAKVSENPADGTKQFEFSDDERGLFPGQFRVEAKSRGFGVVERTLVPVGFPIPHQALFRFGKSPAAWPCYQIGTGLFTANQDNDGYSWENFSQHIRQGLEILSEAHPLGIAGLPILSVELRYIDGFSLDEGESAVSFLKNKLQVSLAVPSGLIDNAMLVGQPERHVMEVSIKSKEPAGNLVVTVREALINGQPGFVMITSLRSTESECPRSTIDTIMAWAKQAHAIQKHAFETLINPAYMRSFK